MKLFGTDLMVFLDVEGTPKSIAFAKNHTIEMTMNTIDTSTKDNGFGRWQDNEPGLRSWTMGSENIVGDGTDPGVSIDELTQAFMEGKKVDVVFALQGNMTDLLAKNDQEFVVPKEGWNPSGKNYYKGKALITSLNISAPNGDYATGNATFTGCGNLQRLGDGLTKSITALSSKTSSPVAESTSTDQTETKTLTIKK